MAIFILHFLAYRFGEENAIQQKHSSRNVSIQHYIETRKIKKPRESFPRDESFTLSIRCYKHWPIFLLLAHTNSSRISFRDIQCESSKICHLNNSFAFDDREKMREIKLAQFQGRRHLTLIAFSTGESVEQVISGSISFLKYNDIFLLRLCLPVGCPKTNTATYSCRSFEIIEDQLGWKIRRQMVPYQVSSVFEELTRQRQTPPHKSILFLLSYRLAYRRRSLTSIMAYISWLGIRNLGRVTRDTRALSVNSHRRGRPWQIRNR